MKKAIYISFLLILFSSCISFKANTTKSPKKLYEEFFINQGVMQYFVKPIEFKNDDYSFTIDFTFRDTVSENSLITSNFSIYYDISTENHDSIFFFADNNQYNFINPTRLYIDTFKKKYVKRYTAYLKYSDMKKFFESENIYITIYSENVNHILYPTKKSQKTIEIINSNLIKIIELNKQ